VKLKTLPKLPRYTSIVPTVLLVIGTRWLNKRRSLRSDALKLTARVTPPIDYQGIENIPAGGGCLVTINHFARPGFNTAWIALGLSAALPAEVTWVMADEWVFEGNALAFLLRPVMRYLLGSINFVYSFLSMPTMVAGYAEGAEKSAAVRRVIEFARDNPQSIIGLAPEGQDSPNNGVGDLPTGSGKFIHYLNQAGFQILPVGITEKEDQLIFRIGKAYDLDVPSSVNPTEIDALVRAQVRCQIQIQLS
jgi:1-acyl-sn-glycerol-3-phosphate acyltransferase